MLIFLMLLPIVVSVCSILTIYLVLENSKKQIKEFVYLSNLERVWENVCQLDKNNLIIPDLVKAINAMSMLVQIWQTNIIEEKVILNYWDSFKILYEQISEMNDKFLKQYDNKTPRDFLTGQMTKFYIAFKSL